MSIGSFTADGHYFCGVLLRKSRIIGVNIHSLYKSMDILTIILYYLAFLTRGVECRMKTCYTGYDRSFYTVNEEAVGVKREEKRV